MMRALVISGGGCKGAFAGGIAEYLICGLGREYQIYVGTSTGSLLIPLLATQHIERIKQVYTSVCQEDIFNICPFRLKKKEGRYITRFNHFGILTQFIRGRKTFGESQNLKQLIRSTFTPEIYRELIASGKFVIVTVANLTRNIVEHKYARDYTYEEFCDWIWISSNLVPFMSLARIDGYEYADGGFGNLIPVQEAINLGATEIDVIILSPRHKVQNNAPAKNAFNLLVKAFHFMLQQIGRDDIHISLLESMYTNVKLNLIHTPRILTDNVFIFDPEEMTAWWTEGYQYARSRFADS